MRLRSGRGGVAAVALPGVVTPGRGRAAPAAEGKGAGWPREEEPESARGWELLCWAEAEGWVREKRCENSVKTPRLLHAECAFLRGCGGTAEGGARWGHGLRGGGCGEGAAGWLRAAAPPSAAQPCPQS